MKVLSRDITSLGANGIEHNKLNPGRSSELAADNRFVDRNSSGAFSPLGWTNIKQVLRWPQVVTSRGLINT